MFAASAAAEASAAALGERMERSRAMASIDAALQTFRRHVARAPPASAGFNTSTFFESEEAVIGKGGCGKVYAWRAGGRDWAVKSDQISFKYRCVLRTGAECVVMGAHLLARRASATSVSTDCKQTESCTPSLRAVLSCFWFG